MNVAVPRRIKFFVGGGVAAFVLAVVAVAAVLIFNARKLALADGASGAVRFVSSAEAALNRSLLGVDVLLASMDEILDLSAVRAEWLDPEVTSQRLRSSARQSLMVRYVALVDRQGRVWVRQTPQVQRWPYRCLWGLPSRCLSGRCRC